MSVILITEKSVVLNVGPTITLRPRFPKLGTAVNTDVSNHWSASPKTPTGPFTSGRSVLATPLTVLFVVTTAVGRIPLGVLAGAVPRYLPLMLPIWLAVYLLAARYPRRLLPATTVLIGLFAVLPFSSMGRQPLSKWPGTFGIRPWQLNAMVLFAISKVAWADNYLATGSWENVPSADVQMMHPSPEGSRFDEKLRFLQERKLTFLASPDRRDYLPWLADDRFTDPAALFFKK